MNGVNRWQKRIILKSSKFAFLNFMFKNAWILVD